MDGFTITLFESADNDARQTQPFMWGVRQTQLHQKII